MSKLSRYTQLVFGSGAGVDQIGQFGSLAQGSIAYANNPAQVQALSNYIGGWFSAILGNNSPAIEDMNALCYLYAYQLAYLFQEGVAEWDSGTTYYTGSLVNIAGTVYVSQVDSNIGNNPSTDMVNWAIFGTGARSSFYNGAFDLWQRGTSTTISNASAGYQADRWYVSNTLGTNGVITYSQVTGVQNGSKYGASVRISTAPTAAQNNGCELYQTLPNLDSLVFYNQTASFGLWIKALGNVNQIGVQFYYNTTESKVATPIGSEVVISVNSSTFTWCPINGQALGTSMTSSGVIGVRVRIYGVSTGHTYDLNNGFVAEQAQLNLGSVVSPFKRMFNAPEAELVACQRFYTKSAPSNISVPQNSGTNSALDFIAVEFSSGNLTVNNFSFPVEMRAVPNFNIWDVAATPASGKMSYSDSGGTLTNGGTAPSFGVSTKGIYAAAGSTPIVGGYGLVRIQFTADADI